MEKVTITFNDGTTLNPDVNGDTYILDEKPDFPIDLTGITIESASGTKTIEHGQILDCATGGASGYWFAIIEIPKGELEATQLKSQVAYIAMMTDVDLEEV